MKKKALSTLLAVSMVAGMVTGCGSQTADTATTDKATATTEAAAATDTTATEATVTETSAEEGKVLKVECRKNATQKRRKNVLCTFFVLSCIIKLKKEKTRK